MRNLRLLFVFAVAAALLAACGSAAQPAKPPTAAPTTAPQSNLRVLFQDDFSNPKSGWDTEHEKEAVIEYKNGMYRMWLNYPHTVMWANPHLDFSDVRVEVSATKAGGTDDNQFGLICRYQDENNFYFFIISSDGYYGIGKSKNGKQTLLTGHGNMEYSKFINRGHATNRLRADCVGPSLAFYVNGQRLARVNDSDFTKGDVGLLIGTFTEPETEVYYDNFVVYQP